MASDPEQAGDCPDDFVEEEETDAEMASKILNFPNVLAALQSHQNAEMIANLPTVVKRRLKALKNLQFENTKLEAEFFKEVHDLECKYHLLHTPLFEKRNNIVNGTYEPVDDECQWPSEDEAELSEDLKDKVKLEDKDNKDVKGIPDFWLTIFRNVSILSEMVQSHDEPILKHLKDIKLICKENPMGFILEFYFEPNEFFTDTVLTKEYHMKCVPEEDDPFNFEGPEIYKCIGCTINWAKGKNVTVKTIRKKQKHKSRGVVRTVTKTVQNDSFFNFFNPPVLPEESKEDIEDDLRNLLTSDFEIGHYIRERIIPRAVLYFTGEGIEEEEDFEEEEDDDDDEEEEDEVGDNDDAAGKNARDQNCKQQ
ncbi:unnamed protein product [Brassicogethes aeneus]|uniref:Nucleosome assembly protein 1-like 1 n=1 Tax=Brassicogethes aeneus TaxID=1431903 RepID=A0A9P0BDX9_BRAAE|nr:unnamed protein product [Brassicogethes aeneus]